MLRLLHESHQGIVKTKLRAKNIMYWPGMLNEIEQFVSDCTICEKFRSDNRKDPLLPHEIPTLPFEKIGSDVLTYRNKDYLVTIPRILICDNMPFGSFEFKKFADSWNFRIVTSSPRYPRSNGLSEKAVGIAKQMLKKKFEENKDINISLLEYRSTVIPTMGASPSELLMSRLLRTKLPAHHLKLKPKLQENVEDKLKSNQYQYKSYHDNRAKRHVTKFEPNQNVVIRRDKVWEPGKILNTANTPRPNQNVVIRRDKVWEPGKILNTANTPRSYIVQDHKGEVLRRNSLHLRPSNNEPLCVNRNAIEHASQESSDNASDPDVSLNTSLPPITTRSGRTVKKPSKYNDYVL
ncbi:Integrase zinc binding domain [Popillia japonica]|uniref:RNA-directed DNA polymerase n=1 Tax=Popillia japonica TaxID=7064 RepID=A0AAW1IFL6_POPJA